MFSYDLTDEDYELPYNAPGKSGSYFELDEDFGRGYPSRRSDGVKLTPLGVILAQAKRDARICCGAPALVNRPSGLPSVARG
jgi:hypothetical protein